MQPNYIKDFLVLTVIVFLKPWLMFDMKVRKCIYNITFFKYLKNYQTYEEGILGIKYIVYFILPSNAFSKYFYPKCLKRYTQKCM
jgi:ABC-type microcin C transport system permease subunit YejE